jgi:type IV pilus assembly protein PilP
MLNKKKDLKRRHRSTLEHVVVLFMFWVLVATVACGPDTESPKQTTPAVQPVKKPAPKVEQPAKSPSITTTEASSVTANPEFTYNPAGKPDPFVPLIAESTMTDRKPDTASASSEDEDLTPLQKYDLSELNLVAIIIRDDNLRAAMVEDKAGYGYILKQGMLVGKNNGIIRQITADSIIVEEKTVDASGSAKTNTVTLTVSKSKVGEE